MNQNNSLGHANVSPDNELPSYNDVARDPNSRFGRWKGWIEKRAAERYTDDTPEKRLARQLKGWGPQIDYESRDKPVKAQAPVGSTSLHRTRTVLSRSTQLEAQPQIAHQVNCEALPPSHAKLCTFGSRFIPHSEYPILSLLPMCSERKLLIGHSCGLCVLDMESEVSDINTKEPRRYDIFYGEGYDPCVNEIHQMDILELEETSFSSPPRGIVLALVGTGSEGGSERNNSCKTIRMYNLAGLASLAQWACDTKGKEPLDLTQDIRSLTLGPDTRKRKSKAKAASVDFGGLPMSRQSSSFVPSMLNIHARHSLVLDEDLTDTKKLPMRWATEYVSVATPGARLENQNVLFYALQRCKERSRVIARLAVATKQSVLLYETLRGERSFRFVKEFYIPASPRSITFVHQRPLLEQRNDFSKETMRGLTASLTSWLRLSQMHNNSDFGQLSLFVTFDKKACLIRILDSSVTELEMWHELKQTRRASSLSLVPGAANPFRLSRSSFEGQILKDSGLTWLPPTEVSLPPFGKTSSGSEMLTVYLLTRGSRTHIVPAPLLVPINMYPPLKILEWGIHPTNIVARLCHRPLTDEPFLQVTALGQEGLEIQEFSLVFLDPNSKGKRSESNVVVQADVGSGGAGFLRMGGHWNRQSKDKPLPPLPLHRNLTRSTVDTFDLHEKKYREQGFYGWSRKGYSDWRVFWLGGDVDDGPPPSPTTP